jgi:hypothetical protein
MHEDLTRMVIFTVLYRYFSMARDDLSLTVLSQAKPADSGSGT